MAQPTIYLGNLAKNESCFTQTLSKKKATLQIIRKHMTPGYQENIRRKKSDSKNCYGNRRKEN